MVQAFERGLVRHCDFLLALRRKAELAAQFDQREDDGHRRPDIGLPLRDEGSGFRIDQRAMLDAADTELDRTADRVGWVAMRSDVGSTLGAFAEDCADLIITILVPSHRALGEAPCRERL